VNAKSKLLGVSAVVTVILALAFFFGWRNFQKSEIAQSRLSDGLGVVNENAQTTEVVGSALQPIVLGETRSVAGRGFVLTESHEARKGDAVKILEELLPKAKAGDPKAAFDAYLKVAQCRNAMKAGLRGESMELYKKAGIEEGVLESTREALEDCKDIMSRQDLLSVNWLEMAADNGLIEARLLYAIDVDAALGSSSEMLRHPARVVRYKQKAQLFLQEAIGAGSVDAMMQMASMYEKGVLLEADPVSAYAHYIAAGKAYPSLPMETLVRKYRSELSAEQLRYANERASLLYEQCCS
jgi:TPR repeat protein